MRLIARLPRLTTLIKVNTRKSSRINGLRVFNLFPSVLWASEAAFIFQ